MSYTATETILYLDKVCVGYKDKNDPTKVNMILKDISLEEKDIHRDGHTATGQTIAFIGRSGRGKSTLFKALTGLLTPTSGKVLISDTNSNIPNSAKEVAEGDVGFVDQKYTLFRHKTLTQILHYAMRNIKNKTDKEKDTIIDGYLTEWGLMEHKNKYPCELSGGQRQRTAILEQMLTSKHFIVLDEPTSGLDYYAKQKVKSSFNKILADDELNTIIFSTHDLEFAVEMADSIYIIGRPEGVEYSTIIKHFDLKQMGFAWTPWGEQHRTLVNDIKNLLLVS